MVKCIAYDEGNEMVISLTSVWTPSESIAGCMNCESLHNTFETFSWSELLYQYLQHKTIKMFKWNYAWKVSNAI